MNEPNSEVSAQTPNREQLYLKHVERIEEMTKDLIDRAKKPEPKASAYEHAIADILVEYYQSLIDHTEKAIEEKAMARGQILGILKALIIEGEDPATHEVMDLHVKTVEEWAAAYNASAQENKS